MSVDFSIAKQRTRPEACTCIPVEQACSGCNCHYPICRCDSYVFPWSGCDACEAARGTTINIGNANAREVLLALGINTPDLYGSMNARELAKLCRRASGIVDDGAPAYEEGRMINCGRRPGCINERVAQLLMLCEEAGDLGIINWG